MQELYLDTNAHVSFNKKALEIYSDYCVSKASYGHPSSLAEPGRMAAFTLEQCRKQIADLIGATKSEQIIFTSTCTQAAEWAMQLLHAINPIAKTYISNLEHYAVKDVASIFDNINYLPNDQNGNIIFSPNIITENIICAHLQNETGTIQPIKELRSYCKYLFSDLSQSLGKIQVNVTDLNIDFAIFSAHKFGGPSSIGFIYLKDTAHWRAFGTGSRYALDRAGTPDVASIVATTTALQNAIDTLKIRTNNMISFQSYLENQLKLRNIEVVCKNHIYRSPNTTFIYLQDRATQILLELSKIGIHIGLGSACGSAASGPSPIIKALNRTGTTQDYLRISQFGDYGEEEAKYFISKLDELL